jgi:hypothetical protein
MCAHQVRSYLENVTRSEHPTGTGRRVAAEEPDDIQQYEIRVRGHLGSRWVAWFDGLTLTDEDDGSTTIRGPVVDQSALHGLIHKLRDVGIPLISLRPLPSVAPTEPTGLRNQEANRHG